MWVFPSLSCPRSLARAQPALFKIGCRAIAADMAQKRCTRYGGKTDAHNCQSERRRQGLGAKKVFIQSSTVRPNKAVFWRTGSVGVVGKSVEMGALSGIKWASYASHRAPRPSLYAHCRPRWLVVAAACIATMGGRPGRRLPLRADRSELGAGHHVSVLGR